MILLQLNQEQIKYLKNSFWMLFEYFMRVLSVVFVTAYIARYLGPEDFGVLSYALAIVSIFMAFSRLGMDSILVRELINNKNESLVILGTGFWLMFVFAVFSYATMALLIYNIESESIIRLYVWIVSIGILFQIFLVVDYNFQSQVRAKYSSIAKSLALITGGAVKICIVYMDLGLFFLALTFALEFALVAVFLLSAYFLKREKSFFLKFDASYIGPLLLSAWPMILSALAIVAYMRIDQLMIKYMLDTQSLGLYSSATRIYEGWIIMFTVVSASLLPVISKLKYRSVKSYRVKLTRLFSLLIWISIAGAVFSTVFRNEIISIIFGPNFSAASRVFSIVMWSAPFAAIGSLTVRYLTIENMERKIAVRTFVALAVNIGLNIIFIPLYGIEGAAISTLIALFIGNYLINYFDKELHFLKCACNNGFMIFLKSAQVEDRV